MRRISMVVVLTIMLTAPGSALLADEPLAPLFDSLGSHTHDISTDINRAQQYFNQGLILHYNFNHAEAVRSFREAQRLDPECAMAYWGEALSFGPHINSGMSPAAVREAWDAINRARELSSNATEKERAFIDALAARYAEPPASNRGELDAAYVDSMRELAERYPDDPDAQALFAEALMITTAWDYWNADGSPNDVTKEILATLETSMEKSPKHPGTNHFYIHTVETRHPERGIGAADRLRGLVPDAGHLLHMPSHIYLQVGRYAEASDVNQRAANADRRYLENHGAHGMYRISYIPHNTIYLCFSASMEGRGQLCLDAANETRDLILEDQLYQPGYGSLTQGFALRYIAMARFGMWDRILNEAQPDERLLYPTAIWHYARGMAYVRTNQLDSARHELEQLRSMLTDDVIREMDTFGINTTRATLQIGEKMLAGELAAAQGNLNEAIALLEEAVTIELNMGYSEPPKWYIMPRQTLGAVLLEADRAADAEAVYRDDLAEWPENGWSLFGLSQALAAQGKADEATRLKQRFDAAWSRADITLSSSRM